MEIFIVVNFLTQIFGLVKLWLYGEKFHKKLIYQNISESFHFSTNISPDLFFSSFLFL